MQGPAAVAWKLVTDAECTEEQIDAVALFALSLQKRFDGRPDNTCADVVGEAAGSNVAEAAGRQERAGGCMKPQEAAGAGRSAGNCRMQFADLEQLDEYRAKLVSFGVRMRMGVKGAPRAAQRHHAPLPSGDPHRRDGRRHR